MAKFISFYFEGNLRWGHFNTPDDVKDLLKSYNYQELRKAQSYSESLEGNKPSFGFYSEYDGELTLGQWIDKNNLSEYFL